LKVISTDTGNISKGVKHETEVADVEAMAEVKCVEPITSPAKVAMPAPLDTTTIKVETAPVVTPKVTIKFKAEPPAEVDPNGTAVNGSSAIPSAIPSPSGLAQEVDVLNDPNLQERINPRWQLVCHSAATWNTISSIIKVKHKHDQKILDYILKKVLPLVLVDIEASENVLAGKTFFNPCLEERYNGYVDVLEDSISPTEIQEVIKVVEKHDGRQLRNRASLPSHSSQVEPMATRGI
jgi:hypothetical protein